ncbi:cyclic peptide export ABC transporter [Thalassospira lucentensis]|uniref:cyclic peptide export ABC transporter n=1 Tax=Thalassospira lucentensis TaxID=168935 RepID=UPI003D2F455A
MLLFKILRTRAKISMRTVIALLTMSAVSTTMVLVIVNMASDQAEEGAISLRLLALMCLSLIGFIWSQHKADTLVSAEVENILHQFRLSLFDKVRTSSPETLDAVGQGPIQSAMTQEMQTISNTLPMLMNGVQQLVLILFVSLYLAWLSLFALALIAVLAALAIGIHLYRIKRVNVAIRDAAEDEGKLFGGLSDLLNGFKEVKMNNLRRDTLISRLHEQSLRTRDTKAEIKQQWSRETSAVQLAFYVMMAAMVFIVPIFTSDYHDVAVQVTTATLFLFGPIGSTIMTLPSFNETEAALAKVIGLQEELGEALGKQQDQEAKTHTINENKTPLGAITEIVLKDVRFTYPGPTGGFSVGPLNASFKRGEIVFITGGNGAGKSTMISLLTGLRAIDDGEILVNGTSLRVDQLQEYRDQFASVLSGYHLFDELYGIDPIDADKVTELLTQMEIADKVTLEGNTFSTISLSQGQRKRLALITALLEEKPVLVLDEWAADQDPHFRSVFYEKLLPSLRKQGKILICVTHDDRWFHLADRIYHVQDGVFDAARE